MSERLTLQDLIDILAEKQNITKKDAENFLRELINLVTETIQEKDFVRIKDFGTFKLTLVSARKSVNVNTGEDIEIPPHYRLNFTPDKLLRESVNKPFAHFESVLLNEDVDFSDLNVFSEVLNKTTLDDEEDEEEDDDATVEKDTPKTIEIKNKDVENIINSIVPENENNTNTLSENKGDNLHELVSQINTKEVEKLQEKQFTSPNISTDEQISNGKDSIISKTVEAKDETFETNRTTTPIVNNNSASNVFDTNTNRSSLEEEKFTDFDQIHHSRKNRKTWLSIGIGLLVISVFGVWIFSTYYIEDDLLPKNDKITHLSIVDEPSEAMANTDNNTPLNTDDQADSNNTGSQESLPLIEETPIEENNPKPEITETSTTTERVFSEGKKVEIKSGQTMRSMGKEYFGNSAFWVYIFEENSDKLKSPDAIYAGMEIIIPDAAKYNIDPKDKESIASAKKLESELFAKFK